MWASKVELSIAAKSLNTHMAYQEHGQAPVSLYGDKPKGHHNQQGDYLLHEFKGTASLAYVNRDIQRAGDRKMRQRSRSRSISTTQTYLAASGQTPPLDNHGQMEVRPAHEQQNPHEGISSIDASWETWGQPRFQGHSMATGRGVPPGCPR